jgi:hypothetical protein
MAGMMVFTLVKERTALGGTIEEILPRKEDR